MFLGDPYVLSDAMPLPTCGLCTCTACDATSTHWPNHNTCTATLCNIYISLVLNGSACQMAL